VRYKLLGKSGLRVSEVGLGTMTFGEAWGWGASREESRRIFDAFVDAGGNFVDTSINYTDGESEAYIGDCLADRRHRLVIATKYSLTTRKDDPNAGGNHRKNMVQSLETSLRRLKTDYIDLYYLHMWDGTTPIDEVMRALDDLVRAGKILYAGISDTPAWIVAQGNTFAELMGWTRFVALQLPYSLATRDAERDLLPMARALGLAVIAWDILDGGILTGKYTGSGTEPRRYGETTISPRQRTLTATVVDIAAELGCTPAQVAIAWVRGRPDRIIPLIGARTAAQLVENLAALTIDIPLEHRQRLDEISRPALGFPHDFLASDHVHGLIFGDTYPLLDNHRNMAAVG
jgi:aryl-alcohol dehydrogenase-like predicted oxidoreductase